MQLQRGPVFLVLAFFAESIIPSYDALQVERHCRGFGRNCASEQHGIALPEVLWTAALHISVSREICNPIGNMLEDFAFGSYFAALEGEQLDHSIIQELSLERGVRLML